MSQLKILLVLEAVGGGAGRHVIDLARELRDLGHDVHLVWSPTRIEAGFENDLASLDGVTNFAIPMHRHPHLSDWTALFALKNYIRSQGGFDLVHGHSSKAGALVRLLRLCGLKTGIVYTPHGIRTIDARLSRPARFVWCSVERVLNRVGGNHTIAVSAHERDHILAHHISSADRLHVVRNGLHERPIEDRERVRRRFQLDEDDVCVGFVGRFSSVKGPLVFLDAIAQAKPRCPHLRVVMLGYGEMRAEVNARIRQHGLNHIIQIHENERGTDCMCAFDVFALSSHQEGMPYVVLEAAAAGLPVIATRAGGVVSLVHHDYNGRLVPIGDVAGLADAIIEVVNNHPLRQRLQQNAEAGRRSFTADQMARETLAVYQTALTASTAKLSDQSRLHQSAAMTNSPASTEQV